MKTIISLVLLLSFCGAAVACPLHTQKEEPQQEQTKR